jgi:conjugative relaxase-like TrwC/TraI family protein
MHKERSLCDGCVTNLVAGSGCSRSLTAVVSTASIPADRAGGYARYLEGKTVAHERGDYYLTPDGEMTQAPGRWLTEPETLQRLGITTGQRVDGEDFIALMEGRHPGTGGWVRREGAGGGRGGGIDVTFSAPKSVSVVWALADPWQSEAIEQAHARAVERSVAYLREQVPVVRRRYGGPVVEETARDVIVVEYPHTTARGINGTQAPDPQLHSHVVITGAIREDERIVAVASRPVFRAARELGAFYRSALAEELTKEGYDIEQNTGKDGKYFEIAGVPHGLCQDLSGRSKEVARAAERFRARHGRAPERGELRNLALENRRTKTLTTQTDLKHAWLETGHPHQFAADQALQLIAFNKPPQHERAVEDRIEARLTEHTAIFDAKDLRAIALEQTAGEMPPDHTLAIAKEMIHDRRVLTLEGGQMTTLAIRAKEQAIERRAVQLAHPADRDVGQTARENATQEVAERIGAPLSAEQQQALHVLTGPERAASLIGPAGTGKGVVIDAAARAEQLAGHETIGVAVSGSTAERLGTDSPALDGQTMTIDALIARANTGRVHVGTDTTIILDEAGMADHQRLHDLIELVQRTGAKLIAVGDGQQLPAIGPGGMFDRIAQHTPTAELKDIYRTQDPKEQQAWETLRAGDPGRAIDHYNEKGQIHFQNTRDQAGEAAVQHWHTLTQEHGLENVALIADASNQEIDRLNARAQHLRTENQELGEQELPLQSVHYGLRHGDRVTFTTQHRPPNEPRVENGSRGKISHLDGRQNWAIVTLDGSERQITLQGDDLESLRLAYAEHIYRKQGATVERSVVLTGGWQTSKESAYVEASRARHGTDWYFSREDLGTDGHDNDRTTRLAERMRHSRRQTPSLAYQEPYTFDWDPYHDPLWGLDRAPDDRLDRGR